MLFFVDGGTGRHSTNGNDLRHGGIGCVAVEHNGRTTITGFGKFFHHDTKVTNQRMELRAIHFVREALERLGKPKTEPLYIWSDSIYAINSLRAGTDWQATANCDLIVPFQRELRELNIVEMNHVRSHVRRKSKSELLDFLLHEMADKLASEAVKTRRGFRTPILTNRRVDTKCLGCSQFPCRHRDTLLKTMRIDQDYESCSLFSPLRSWVIKNYSVEELEEYCL